VVEHVRLDTRAPLDDVLETTLEAMKRQNERTDREKVEAAIGGYRSGGLGVVGPEATLDALMKRQVEELLVTASVNNLRALSPSAQAAANDAGLAEPAVETTVAGEAAQGAPEVVRLADELVAQAKQNAARITFIEDPELLQRHGGVAALLRFRI
jgi:peptide subunit release factor 1 (eRF1)